MSDLGLVPFDDLVEEIKRRSGVAVFATIRVGYEDEKTYTVTKHYAGNKHQALGLCADLTDYLMHELREERDTLPGTDGYPKG